MVGFHTSFVPKYTDRLESQLSTWAAHIPSNHILVAGGKHDNIGATIPSSLYSKFIAMAVRPPGWIDRFKFVVLANPSLLLLLLLLLLLGGA